MWWISSARSMMEGASTLELESRSWRPVQIASAGTEISGQAIGFWHATAYRDRETRVWQVSALRLMPAVLSSLVQLRF